MAEHQTADSPGGPAGAAADAASPRRRLRFGFRSWLLLLALITALPIILFSLVSVAELAQSQQRSVNERLARRAKAAADAVDRNLDFKTAMLQALTHTEAGLAGDLHGLYNHAKNLEPVLPDVLALTVIDRDGAQRFNTMRPFGLELPPPGNSPAAQAVIRDGRPAVSGLYAESVSGKPVTALGVPVRVRRTPLYCLRMVTPADEFNALLAEQRPDDATATLIDAGGVIVARTSAAQAFVGTRVDASLLAALAKSPGEVFDSVSQEGLPIRVALAPVADWGWHVAVHVPRAALQAPVRLLLLRLALGGLLCLVVGLAGAWLLSRRLAGEVDLMSSATAALASGNTPAMQPSLVREFLAVGASLNEAKVREEKAELDHLTQLPSRARFMRLATGLQDLCAQHPGLRLVVMFLDLDGFKQVNDQHGHDQGDAILVATARILEAETRGTDALGRLGGDEFVICLAAPSASVRTTAEGVAGRIIAKVREIGFGIGCSIGVVLCPEDAPNLEQALLRSDEAMYAAKQAGKNRYSLRDLAQEG